MFSIFFLDILDTHVQNRFPLSYYLPFTIHHSRSLHFGHPLRGFGDSLNTAVWKPCLARRHPAVAGLTRELTRHREIFFVFIIVDQLRHFGHLSSSFWTPSSRTVKSYSRTKTQRFFTIHQLPFTIHVLYIWDIHSETLECRWAYCYSVLLL